jgi:hypothetical protein
MKLGYDIIGSKIKERLNESGKEKLMFFNLCRIIFAGLGNCRIELPDSESICLSRMFSRLVRICAFDGTSMSTYLKHYDN